MIDNSDYLQKIEMASKFIQEALQGHSPKIGLRTLLLSLQGWGCVGTTRSQERVLDAPEYKQMLEKENVLLLDFF